MTIELTNYEAIGLGIATVGVVGAVAGMAYSFIRSKEKNYESPKIEFDPAIREYSELEKNKGPDSTSNNDSLEDISED